MTSKNAHLAIFASGNGTNAEAIIQYFQHHPSIKVSLLVSNNSEAKAIERANRLGVETNIFTKNQFRESDEIINALGKYNISHIILAGFLLQIPPDLIYAFPKRIINIHPSLLPKFGGKGMYGMKVHEAVKVAEETETGITIHEVNEEYDEGKIIFRASCHVEKTDSPENIAQKIHQLEHEHYPKVIEQWIISKDH